MVDPAPFGVVGPPLGPPQAPAPPGTGFTLHPPGDPLPPAQRPPKLMTGLPVISSPPERLRDGPPGRSGLWAGAVTAKGATNTGLELKKPRIFVARCALSARLLVAVAGSRIRPSFRPVGRDSGAFNRSRGRSTNLYLQLARVVSYRPLMVFFTFAIEGG